MQCKDSTEHVWNPWGYYSQGFPRCPYAVMILNRPISGFPNINMILNIWNDAEVRHTVDGGTDQWLTLLQEHKINNAKEIELVTGDMDSIKPETLQKFEQSQTTKVIRTINQDETDFEKALKAMSSYVQEKNIKIGTVLVITDISGRLDHICSNISTLYKLDDIIPGKNVLLLGQTSLSWALKKGNNKIFIPKVFIERQHWCSLLPVGHPCTVTTTGLKWNLDNGVLEFGKLVSSSNTYNCDKYVTVNTDKSIVWSMSTKYIEESKEMF